MWVYYIFCELIIGFVCYKLAENKEKDKWWAFLMGCLFGIWAILYYAFCQKGGVPCSFCKELHSKEATICPHCQKDLKEIK